MGLRAKPSGARRGLSSGRALQRGAPGFVVSVLSLILTAVVFVSSFCLAATSPLPLAASKRARLERGESRAPFSSPCPLPSPSRCRWLRGFAPVTTLKSSLLGVTSGGDAFPMGLMKEKMEKKPGEIPTPLWDVITVLGSDPPGAAARPPLLELRERARIKKKKSFSD